MTSLTPRSPSAQVTQGRSSPAKPTPQKTPVSSTAASTVAISGARHQRLWRRRSNTAMSSICDSRKARPDAAAMRAGARMADAATATAKPTQATRRAWAGPKARLTSSVTRKAKG